MICEAQNVYSPGPLRSDGSRYALAQKGAREMGLFRKGVQIAYF